MYIHRLEGNWFRHPFWKARFVLDDPARLRALRESRVEWVLIDPMQGRDVAIAANDVPPGAGSPRPSRPMAGAAMAGRRAVDLSHEMLRAERLARQAGKAVNRLFLEARLGKRVAASDVAPVVDEIYLSIQRNIYAFNGLLRCQSDQVHLYRHALAVAALMVALAQRLGLAPAATRAAGMVGMMMDIALAQLSAEVSVADYRDLAPAVAKGHVLFAHTLMRAAGDIPPDVLTGCLQHHERLDGSGYPNGLSGTTIGLFGRMAAVCDSYDQLVTGMPDTPALDPARALGVIAAQPHLYDAMIVGQLVEAVGAYPIGSFVRLRSGRLAMVVDQDDADVALPTVRIFASIDRAGGAIVPCRQTTLALGQCYGEDAIACIADAAELRLPPLDRLREELMAGALRAANRA